MYKHKDSTGWPIIVGARVKVTPPHPNTGVTYKATVTGLEKEHIRLTSDIGLRWTYPSWTKVLRSGPKRKRTWKPDPFLSELFSKACD